MNEIARATKTKKMVQTLRATLQRSQAAFRETGKISVLVALLAYGLGWREKLIIAVAVPITFSITLLINLFWATRSTA